MGKIIFNTDSLIMGGAEKIAMDYINLLNESGKHEILLLINEDNGESGNVLIDRIPKNIKYKFVVDKNIIYKLNKYRELKKNNLYYKLFYNYFLKKRRKNYEENIRKIIKEEEYDYLVDFYFKIPEDLLDERSISWIHSSLEGIKNKRLKKTKTRLEKIGKIIVITEDLKKEVEKYFPTQIGKAKMIYNFFDIKEIEEQCENIDELKIEEKELLKTKYILACSRLDDKKDLKTLIKAFKILKDKHKIKEKLYIVGDGPSKYKYEKIVEGYNLEKDILFLGTKSNPYVWMKNAKLFVHSSLREGFGMVLVEAMICETMVISTDCPVGPSEILEKGKSGILVDIGDYEKMAEEIKKYLYSKEEREKIISNASKRILDFSKEKIKKDIEEIL